MSIDIGGIHMSLCLKFSNDPVYKCYLFSFIDPNKKIVYI